ncbi:eIF-2-alpha kinase [Dirofilaria immitis]
MIPSSIGILLRAKQGRYLMMTSAEKAFLQVSLKWENRDVTRFLWLKGKSKESSQENIATFRFAQVSFGIFDSHKFLSVSSPFLLVVVIRYLLSEENSKLSMEASRNFFLDNVVLISENELGSTRKAREAKEFFKKVKIHLRGFHANHEINVEKVQELPRKTGIKLLSIEWDNNTKNEFSRNEFIWKVQR